MRKIIFRLLSLLAIASVVLVACATPTPAVQITATPEPAAGRVQIRWFVGLGTGTNPEQQAAQNKVVQEFNASQDKIKLVIEIVDNTVAADTLQTQIASGDPPDLIGPVGTRGSNSFAGLFLDLGPYIEKTKFDTSRYAPALIDFYKSAEEGQTGLPFAVYPAVIFYNRDLFDEAGLAYPPHTVGEKYVLDGKEVEWNTDTLAEVAMRLTVDTNGNDATSAEFDPEQTQQWGFLVQWTEEDPRAEWTMFGPGAFVGSDDKAIMPDHWRAAAQWFYAGLWEKHFIPAVPEVSSDLLAAGNPFNSNNLGMALVNSWYTCCLADVKNWDVAVVPSYNGKNTAKLHADTFRILKSTKHPEEAFTVLEYFLTDAAPQLFQAYGALPADKSLQSDFFATLEETYPQGVDWDVIPASLSLADNPSHESNMPNFLKADQRDKQFGTLYRSEGNLDLDADLGKLISDLQAIFDEAK